MSNDPQERMGELQGKLCAQLRAEGYAMEMRTVVLKVLEHRQIMMSDVQRRIIAGCMDPVVCARWFEQALTVSSVDELFR